MQSFQERNETPELSINNENNVVVIEVNSWIDDIRKILTLLIFAFYFILSQNPPFEHSSAPADSGKHLSPTLVDTTSVQEKILQVIFILIFIKCLNFW